MGICKEDVDALDDGMGDVRDKDEEVEAEESVRTRLSKFGDKACDEELPEDEGIGLTSKVVDVSIVGRAIDEKARDITGTIERTV